MLISNSFDTSDISYLLDITNIHTFLCSKYFLPETCLCIFVTVSFGSRSFKIWSWIHWLILFITFWVLRNLSFFLMFSSGSLVVSTFTFRSKIHLKLIFCYGVRVSSKGFSVNRLDRCRTFPGLTVLICWPICILLHQYHTFLIIVAL